DTDDGCGQCHACAIAWLSSRHDEERDRAADLGSRLHQAAEVYALFGPGAAVDDDVAPLLKRYAAWLDAWQPEFIATEATVISRKYGYAGTLDKIVRLNDP